MATVTSHLLDAVDGRSAVGATVALYRIGSDQSREEVFRVTTDEEGRINQTVETAPGARYELVFETAAYFKSNTALADSSEIIDAVVVRLSMPDPDRRYHIPVIASPHGYSLWWSK